MKTDRAIPAAVGAAVPAGEPETTPVQTPAQALAKPSQRHPRDEHTGVGGQYVRDPVTGVRTKVEPPAAA